VPAFGRGVLVVKGTHTTARCPLFLWGQVLIGTALPQEGETEAVGLVCGVNGCSDRVEAAAAGGLEGAADRGAGTSGEEADLVQRLPQCRASPLGDLTDPLGVAGFIGVGVEAGQCPDLSGRREAMDIFNADVVPGGQERADAGDGEQEASVGMWEQGVDVGFGGFSAFVQGDILPVVVLEALGVDGGHGIRRQGSLAEHRLDPLEGLRAGPTDVVPQDR
jgi:hypothetical protein